LNIAHLRVAEIGETLREGSTSLGAFRRALTGAKEAGAETELEPEALHASA
jgi:hypothetical protein